MHLSRRLELVLELGCRAVVAGIDLDRVVAGHVAENVRQCGLADTRRADEQEDLVGGSVRIVLLSLLLLL